MFKKKVLVLITAVLLVALCFAGCKDKEENIDTEAEQPEIIVDEDAIYVATTGEDSNPGTFKQPFLTIQKGASVAKPGETVYIRGGTYHEEVSVDSSGTAEAIITISGYPGEEAILDGKNILPTVEDPRTQNRTPIFIVQGSHVLVKDLTVQNCTSRGIQSVGEYVTFRNLLVQQTFEDGIHISNQYNVIEDCEVINASRVFLIANDGPPALTMEDTSNGIIRRNYIHDNKNIGIGVVCSYYATVEDNILRNNHNTQIFLDNAAYPLVQRNLMFYDEDYFGIPSSGIMITNKDHPQLEESMGVGYIIINNIINKVKEGLTFWPGTRSDSALIDALICNNTIINVRGIGIVLNDQTEKHKNNIISNNIVHVRAHTGARLAYGLNLHNPGITVENNCWSGNPGGWWADSGDVYGNPELLAEGDFSQLDFYKLTSSSPCIDKGIAFSDVTVDLFGKARDGKPDIGASEFQGIVLPSELLPSPAADLKDIKETDKFFSSVNMLLIKNVISPYSDNTFRPEDPVTAGDFVKMIVDALRVSNDLRKNSSPTEDYMKEAKEMNIITGTEFNDYSNDIKHGDIIPILAKASIISGEGNPLNMTECKENIKNYSSLNPALANFVLQLYSKGIIGLNSSGEFNDALIVTRGDAAEVIAKFLDHALRIMPEVK